MKKRMKKRMEDFFKKLSSQSKNLNKGTAGSMYASKAKAVWHKVSHPVMIIFGIELVVFIVLFGYIEAHNEGYRYPEIGNVLLEGVDGFSLPVYAIILLLEWLLIYFGYNFLHTGKGYDEKRNLITSEKGTCGTAHEMTEEEKAEAFNSGNFISNKANVLGKDPKTKKLMSVKPGYGINGNVIVFGSPGAGKSRCLILLYIFYTILRGESLIITDPKGELYRKTSEMARAHGYTVRIFNVNPDQMLHSDGVDFMKIIGDDEFMIDAFVDTIMCNISGTTQKEFWDKSSINELKFATTYVATNTVGIEKTLGGVFEFLNSNSVQEIENIFFNLPDDHPAKPSFNIWAQGDKTVKGNTHASLQIDLQKLSNKLVQKITGTDEIDLTLPGKEKCIYYLSMNDQERSMGWAVALFFSFAIKCLVKEADSRKSGMLKVKVTLLLDEFYNIGLLPDFDSKIAQIRSRNIDSVLILQSLGQLQKMYPDNVWESIIDCCSTMMLLATRSLLTAKYFSEYSGEQTVISTGYRMNKMKGIEGEGTWVQETTSETRRYLYTPHEVITKNKNHILVSTSTFNMCEIEKLDYEEHPMCKEIREVNASEHKPKWIDSLTPEERKRFRVDNAVFKEEGVLDIELCTEADFAEPWTTEKKKKLQKAIREEKIRKGIPLDEEEYDEDYNMFALTEDRESEPDIPSVLDVEEDASSSNLKYDEETGVFKKDRVVYNSFFDSNDEMYEYKNESKRVTPEEHMRRINQNLRNEIQINLDKNQYLNKK